VLRSLACCYWYRYCFFPTVPYCPGRECPPVVGERFRAVGNATNSAPITPTRRGHTCMCVAVERTCAFIIISTRCNCGSIWALWTLCGATDNKRYGLVHVATFTFLNRLAWAYAFDATREPVVYSADSQSDRVIRLVLLNFSKAVELLSRAIQLPLPICRTMTRENHTNRQPINVQ
jgi:hypothetical protein